MKHGRKNKMEIQPYDSIDCGAEHFTGEVAGGLPSRSEDLKSKDRIKDFREYFVLVSLFPYLMLPTTVIGLTDKIKHEKLNTARYIGSMCGLIVGLAQIGFYALTEKGRDLSIVPILANLAIAGLVISVKKGGLERKLEA